MKSVQKVSLETAIENESLEISFSSNGGVEIQIMTYNGEKDSFESKIVSVSKKEWDLFKDYLSDDVNDKSERKCGICGGTGHNSRTCPSSIKLPEHSPLK